jgi:hypothetical protein
MGFGFGSGFSIGFSPFSLTNFTGFWKSFVLGGNLGGSWVVSSLLQRWLGFGVKEFLGAFGSGTWMSPITSNSGLD